MADHRIPQEENDELAMKARYGEELTPLEAFLLRKREENQQRRLNPLEEIAAAYRRNPWTGEE